MRSIVPILFFGLGIVLVAIWAVRDSVPTRDDAPAAPLEQSAASSIRANGAARPPEMLDDKPSTVRNSAKAIDGRRTGAQAYNDKQEELRKIGRQLYPQRLRRAYEMVVAALVNSPEEEEKLLVLVVERELSQLDTVDLAYEAGAHHKTGQDMRLEAKAEVDAEIVGEFGEQVYERVLQMEDYRTHLLTIGNALHPWMKELGTELRNEQVMPLAVIMKSASVDTRGHPPAAWSVRILEQSRSILTPAQHAALAHALSSYIAGRR